MASTGQPRWASAAAYLPYHGLTGPVGADRRAGPDQQRIGIDLVEHLLGLQGQLGQVVGRAPVEDLDVRLVPHLVGGDPAPVPLGHLAQDAQVGLLVGCRGRARAVDARGTGGPGRPSAGGCRAPTGCPRRRSPRPRPPPSPCGAQSICARHGLELAPGDGRVPQPYRPAAGGERVGPRGQVAHVGAEESRATGPPARWAVAARGRVRGGGRGQVGGPSTEDGDDASAARMTTVAINPRASAHPPDGEKRRIRALPPSAGRRIPS